MQFPEFLRHLLRHSEIIKFYFLEVSLSLTWYGNISPKYLKNSSISRWSFLSFFSTAHVTQKLSTFLCLKFHWVWRDLEGKPELSRKWCISGRKKRFLSFSGSATVTLNYRFFYFQSFAEFDVISDERPELSKKWGISATLF